MTVHLRVSKTRMQGPNTACSFDGMTKTTRLCMATTAIDTCIGLSTCYDRFRLPFLV